MVSGQILSGAEALSAQQSFNYIIPFPYSSNIELGEGGELDPRLSVMSRMAIDAAAAAWEAHPGAKIVIPGETCYEGLPSTTDLMYDRALEVSPSMPISTLIPLSKLPDGQRLNNTYLQTAALANYCGSTDSAQANRSLIVPLGYHQKRVMHTVRAYGLGASFAAAEDILHESGVTAYDQYLPHIAQLERSERVLRLVNRVDRKGRIFNFMTKVSGPRLVDVVDAGAGLSLISARANDKVKALQASTTGVPKPYTA